MLFLFVPINAYALSNDVKAVFTTGAYGAAAGTVLGLAAFPFIDTGVRTIFMGTSAGLALGLVVGIFHVTHKDDPDNPLRTVHADYETRGGFSLASHYVENRPLLRFTFEVYEF